MKLNTFTNLLIMSVLSLGFAEVAQADMKWFETINGYCPDVCQKNARTYKKGNPFHKEGEYIDKENAAYKFAVPSGIHRKTGKTHYICAVNYARTGWRAGHNIEWGVAKNFCYAQWHKMNSGKNSYQEHYFCLCADTEIPPITDDMVKR